MHRFLTCCAFLWALGLCGSPSDCRVWAQHSGRCCESCRQPAARCCCARPMLRPVVQTEYTQRQVLREREQVATEYRTEPVQERVPATIVENVTVDEGGYQTVWVPRLTTKAVPRTVWQNRTSYRTVPYQVTRRVPEYAWETVPRQVVRYVPADSAIIAQAPQEYRSPIVSARPLMPAQTADAGLGLSPDPRFSVSMNGTGPAGYGYGYDNSGRSIPPSYRYDEFQPISPSFDEVGIARGPSLSVPAPSAAQVWRNRAVR